MNTGNDFLTDNLNETLEIPNYDLVCLSHLRWDFVYQRPQHLLSRFARQGRVFFVEEPIPLPEGERDARLDLSRRTQGLTVVVPRLPRGLSGLEADEAQRPLLSELFAAHEIVDFVL